MQEDSISDPSSNTDVQVHTRPGWSDTGRASQPLCVRVSALDSDNGKPQTSIHGFEGQFNTIFIIRPQLYGSLDYRRGFFSEGYGLLSVIVGLRKK